MILLTGATGFLGSHLLVGLLANGHEVIAIKRSYSNTSRISNSLKHKKLHLYDIDLIDDQTLFTNHSIDTIVHTATEYGRGNTPTVQILQANLILPLRLVELGIKNGVNCFINTDSYFNKYNNTYSNLLNYSLSKNSLLGWLNQLTGKIKVINIVLEHIYGSHDSESKFVESVIKNIAVQKVKKMALTHGHQRRDFIYVDDVVSAFLKLIEYGQNHNFIFKKFEVGTGESIQVRDLPELVKKISKSPTVLAFGEITYRSDELMDSKADISQLRELNWVPKISITDGIRKILTEYGVTIVDSNF